MLVPLLSSVLAAAPAGALGPLERELAWAAPLPHELHAPDPVAPPTWAELPVARTLHPVAFHYGARFQGLLADTMGGTRASPVFGPVVAQADVHWRLLAATGRGLPLDALSPAQWRDTALAGTFLAGERLFDETIARAPVLHGAYVVGDTLLSPSLEVRRRGPKQVEVNHRDGGSARRNVERAEAELVDVRRERNATPTLGAGLDWDLREEDAPENAPLLRYTAWLNLTELGITGLRVEFAPASLTWTVSGKEQLRPRLYLIGSARSDEKAPDPARLSGGVMWLLPWRGNWNLRVERIVPLLEDDARWMVTLRCENRTDIPAPLAPVLGDRGLAGPTLPWVTQRGPNGLTRW
jgi:hypothetical protein